MIAPNPINPTVAPHSMRGPAFLREQRCRKEAGPRVKHGATEWGLAGELGRDTKSVLRKVAMLTATGLTERRAADQVAVMGPGGCGAL